MFISRGVVVHDVLVWADGGSTQHADLAYLNKSHKGGLFFLDICLQQIAVTLQAEWRT
jgi:hypothetical protein